MKVAISLPDTLFEAAEQLAQSLKKPRSKLYAEALAKYVDGHETSAVTERLNAVYDAEPSTVEEVLRSAQSKTLSHEAW